MARDITDALAEWVAKQPARRRHDAQAVAFLAVRTDVVKALEAGYSIKTIWAFLKDQGRITSSYEMFRRHMWALVVLTLYSSGSDPPALEVLPTHSSDCDPPR